MSTSTVYDFSTGAVISNTDANGQTASFQYNDVLDRPTQLRRAVNTTLTNQTTVIYDDTNRTITTTSDQTGNNDNVLKSQVIYDQLGRTIETRSYENSSQYITVKKIPYVPLQDPDTGVWVQASQVSNPFRHNLGDPSNVGEQPVWTTSFSDALGRPAKVRTSDNAIVRTYYDGARVLVKDQAGKERLTKTNALGQLEDVWEVTPADSATEAISFPGRSEVTAGYHTSYAYDALNNLLTVTQGSQTRTSAYDSLKRVLSTTNPENGMVSFQYDNNGNVTQRTDARQPAVTTTYGYDKINRPITRTYSDGTPGVTYKYDSASGVSNAKGRAVSISSSDSTYSFSGYDELGRVTGGTQTLGSQTYSMGYTYDLAGHVLSETYPSGRSVTNNFDSAGRLSSVTGTLGDGASRNYSSGIIYSALGGMTNEQFGTDTPTPIYHKLQYNVRGQLWDTRVGTAFSGNQDWNRGALQFFYDQSYSYGGSGTDNNGNVLAAKHYRPLDEGGSTYTISTDQYSYDTLNRITSVSENYESNTQSATQQFQQSYVYDRYGNRTINQGSTWGAGINNQQFTPSQTNNRLGVPSGQSGTMTYDNAGNLTNDTYSGQGQRNYDAENRMTQAWANSQWQTYTYDANGQRVKRSININGTQTETWQVYGVNGELLAEYAANASASSPQKEYGYRNGQLLVEIMAAGGSGWGSPPSFTDNPLAAGVVVKALHITQLRTAINDLRGHLNKAAYPWQYSATTNDWISANPILEMRTALDDALGVPTPAYSAGLAQGQPIKAIHIQELRDRVTAAWGSGSGGVDIRWLVADQLGTPRIILDKTGALANVKRHDYLPFGEELFAGQGGRTTQQGYIADGVRQQFTSKERDNETGLDYFLARYYSSTQGRFISVDPALDSAKPVTPQSWNRYSYCLNNPLKFIDPTGKRWATQYNGDDKKWYFAWFTTDKQYDAAITSGQYQAVDFNESQPYEFMYQEQSERDLNVRLNPDGTHDLFTTSHPGPKGIDMMQNQAFDIGIGNATGGLVSKVLGRIFGALFGRAASEIANPVPGMLARAIPGRGPFPTLGLQGAEDVMVTAADDIGGMSATQLAPRLGIPKSNVFTVIEFPPPSVGLASPINRANPLFRGFGRTSGDAREFVVPNGPIPANATIRIVE